MQVQIQKLSPVLVEFDVQVAVERVKHELDKAYTNVAKTARVRGFRPGKAPRSVLVHMFGAKIAADVAQRLVDETFPQVVSEQKLQPVSAPAIEPQKLEDNRPFSYKARFEIVPEISGVNYEELPAKRSKIQVTDEQLGEELRKLRLAHSTLEPPKQPRPAAKGDVLTIDFEVSVGADVVPEAGATDFQVELGSGSVLPAIDEALQGKGIGDRSDAEIEMPAAHPHPRLRGRKAKFVLTVKDMKQRVLPDADDEFAKDVGEFETLEELRKDILQKLEKQAKEASDNSVAEQLVIALVNSNPIPVPPSLVERQSRMTEQEILSRARSGGSEGASSLGDDLRAKVREDSEIKVRAGLLMAEIAKREGIKIGDEDIEKALVELSEQSGKNVAKLRAEYRDQKRREILIGMILENKVLDIVEAKAKIEEG